MDKVKQTETRIAFKTFLYRIISIIISFSVGYCWTGQLLKSLYLTIFIELVQTINYFVYENIWEQINWGLI